MPATDKLLLTANDIAGKRVRIAPRDEPGKTGTYAYNTRLSDQRGALQLAPHTRSDYRYFNPHSIGENDFHSTSKYLVSANNMNFLRTRPVK